jgi:hypothetical protein
LIERNTDALARHTIWMCSVVTDRDEEPARTLALALAGEDERVCAMQSVFPCPQEMRGFRGI